ncbi:MAG: D-glycero-beta-D-manno-heptose-7-phosphate kinase [Bacteroidetes bacterium]|nr:MAG: D-glycero-beta-D-manno-heptose-7-phosphate kinase [Bacteroidota bacterium]
MGSYSQLVESFGDKRVMVVGDVMVDSYLWGVVDRISPEAPVPVVDVNHREERLGGAANVAVNISALGAEAVLCSVVGTEMKADVFLNIMEKEGLSSAGIYRSDDRITTTKFRIIGNNSQLLRVDEEVTHDLNPLDEKAFLDLCLHQIKARKIDVMIIQDYNKGILTPVVIEGLIVMARENDIPVVVDPKKKNFDLYRNVRLFKPNLKELKEGLKIDFREPDKDILNDTVNLLRDEINVDIALITLSEHGIYISARKDQVLESHLLPAHMRNIADVSGAGDTVVSVASLCLAADAPLKIIAEVSNLAGGIVCEKVGVVPIDRSRFMEELGKLGG